MFDKVKDKNGNEYNIKNSSGKNPKTGRTKIKFDLFYRNNFIGYIILTFYDRDSYAFINDAFLNDNYIKLGIYTNMIPLMTNYVKTEYNLKGIMSEKNNQSDNAKAFWKNYKGNVKEDNVGFYVEKKINMITTINEFKKQQYNIKLDRKTVFSYIEWQGNCKDLYPGYSNPEDVSDITNEYYFETKKKAYQYADEVINLFTSLPNPIPVYRCIKAKDVEHIDLEMHGESWSFEKQSALNFGSRNGSNFLLSTFVNKQDVNWQGTIKAYTIFSGGYSDEDENEIVVDGILKDIKITKLKDKNINESNFNNISTSSDELYKKLLNFFDPIDIERPNGHYLNNIGIYFKNIKYVKVKDIIEKSNWYISKINHGDIRNYNFNDNDIKHINIKPIFSDNIITPIPKFLYHFSPSLNDDKILKTGLIGTTGGKLGILHPKRIYLSTDIDTITNIVKELNWTYNTKEWTIWKIDTTKFNIDKLYIDETVNQSFNNPKACYIQRLNIPSFALQIYKHIDI